MAKRRQAQQTKTLLFDGAKAVNIDDLPDSAWTWYSGNSSSEGLQGYYKSVPWLFRAVSMRADAVAALPFALVKGDEDYDTSDDWQNKVKFLPDPTSLLWLVEAALCLVNRAYLFREQNRVRTLKLRYLLPTSVTPEIDEENGLTGFIRTLNSGSIKLDVDDLLYFWRLDPFVEVGPSDCSPAQAALNAAGVLYNVDRFAAEFFKRGAIKATLLTVSGNPPASEKDKVKAWWQRLFSGVENAWSTEVVSADMVKPVPVGEGIAELANMELTKERREDIATALGIPLTLLWSTQASGLGGGGVVQQDDINFYSKTIVPESGLIATALNSQLFEPMGLRWEFRPESLDVYQADENERSQALLNYTNAGVPWELAGQMLGLELPPGYTWEQLEAEKEERKRKLEEQMAKKPEPPPFGQPPQGEEPEEPEEEAVRADLRRWKAKALKRGPGVPFESEHIPLHMMNVIHARLGLAETAEDIKAAFLFPMPVTFAETKQAHVPQRTALRCPVCGFGEADLYLDHGGLCVCRNPECGCTYDPAVPG